MRWRLKLFIVPVLIIHQVALASEHSPTQAEKEAWFNDDSEFRIAEVNEGKLNFLVNSEKASSHRSINRVKILPSSTSDGWVEMAQCHRGLDAVPLAQLVFPEYIIRQLRVTKKQGIAEAVVDGNSVQLANLSRGAMLCVEMQIKGLRKESDGQYSLTNGPYQRRFLDGYYPMSIELIIDYSESNIKPVSVYPALQPGMQVAKNNGQLVVNANFEGVLRTQVLFSQEKGRSRGQEEG